MDGGVGHFVDKSISKCWFEICVMDFITTFTCSHKIGL